MALIRKILSLLGEEAAKYKVSFCGPTGSDAVEAAMKLAKHYTGRTSMIAFQGGYHGMSSGSLSVTSNKKLRMKLGSLVPRYSFRSLQLLLSLSF